MKKIVHIVPTFELGGVQTGILYSLIELNEFFDFTILVIGKIDKEWLYNLPPQIQERIISTGAENIFWGWIKGFRLLKKKSPDFVISSLWKSAGLSVMYKLFHRKVRLAGFFHSATSLHFVQTFFMKLLCMVQDIAFADSGATKEFVTSFYKVNNIHIIPYYFTFSTKATPKSIGQLPFKMAFFGRLSYEKGVDRTIEFCNLLRKQGHVFIFDIYGEGQTKGQTEYYLKKIKEYKLENFITIKGALPLGEVLEKMRGHDFLLHLSNFEGMGLAVVEAMNCGLVPIVTPVGEIAKYTRDGENAIWLNHNFDDNLEVLVNKVMLVVKNPSLYKQMSSAAATTFLSYNKYSDTMCSTIKMYI